MRNFHWGLVFVMVCFSMWAAACSAPLSEMSAPFTAAPEPTEAAAALPTEPGQAAPEQPTAAAELPTSASIQPTAVLEQPTAAPEILEKRRLTLEWPETIRAGDGDVIRLTLEVAAAGELVSTAETPGHQTSAKIVQIPDLFATHHVLAEARLDLAGVRVEPADLVSQTLLPGQRVDFYWSVKPEEVGIYRGTVWFYLRFIPINGGAESQRTISAQPIQIRSVNLLGLTGTPARVVGVLGSLVGSALGLDNLVSWAWKLLRRKRGV